MVPAIPVAIGIGAILSGGFALRLYFSKLKTKFYKKGVADASKEFDNKFDEQYNDFMDHNKSLENDKREYEKLIKEYEEYIKILQEGYDELMRKGSASASCTAIATLGMTADVYKAKLEDEIQRYTTRYSNLLALREQK